MQCPYSTWTQGLNPFAVYAWNLKASLCATTTLATFHSQLSESTATEQRPVPTWMDGTMLAMNAESISDPNKCHQKAKEISSSCQHSLNPSLMI